MEDFRNLLVRTTPSMFNGLKIGNFILSIQASSTHYCTPRQYLDDPFDYEEFEVAIFEGGSWINPLTDDRFLKIEELIKGKWEGGSFPVGAYIASEIVQQLCDIAESLSEGATPC